MRFAGIPIVESEFLQPDFFAISDWGRPEATATPEWHTIYYMRGNVVVHPSTAKKMRELTGNNWAGICGRL